LWQKTSKTFLALEGLAEEGGDKFELYVLDEGEAVGILLEVLLLEEEDIEVLLFAFFVTGEVEEMLLPEFHGHDPLGVVDVYPVPLDFCLVVE
jgi:hypothetical protein